MFSTMTMDEYTVIAAISAFAMVLGALIEVRRSARLDREDRRSYNALADRVHHLEIEFARECGRRDPYQTEEDSQ